MMQDHLVLNHCLNTIQLSSCEIEIQFATAIQYFLMIYLSSNVMVAGGLILPRANAGRSVQDKKNVCNEHDCKYHMALEN